MRVMRAERVLTSPIFASQRARYLSRSPGAGTLAGGIWADTFAVAAMTMARPKTNVRIISPPIRSSGRVPPRAYTTPATGEKEKISVHGTHGTTRKVEEDSNQVEDSRRDAHFMPLTSLSCSVL